MEGCVLVLVFGRLYAYLFPESATAAMNTSLHVALVFVCIALLVAPEAALAYGGPGSVISGIGAFLAAVAALLAALFGFIWFPLKRLFQAMRGSEKPGEEVAANQSDE